MATTSTTHSIKPGDVVQYEREVDGIMRKYTGTVVDCKSHSCLVEDAHGDRKLVYYVANSPQVVAHLEQGTTTTPAGTKITAAAQPPAAKPAESAKKTGRERQAKCPCGTSFRAHNVTAVYCPFCRKRRQAEAQKRYHAANREKTAAASRARYAAKRGDAYKPMAQRSAAAAARKQETATTGARPGKRVTVKDRRKPTTSTAGAQTAGTCTARPLADVAQPSALRTAQGAVSATPGGCKAPLPQPPTTATIVGVLEAEARRYANAGEVLRHAARLLALGLDAAEPI